MCPLTGEDWCECHTGDKARPFRKPYSLFTEAPKPAQHAVDGALVVVPQVCLQHSGQGVLLHPHLDARERDTVTSSSSHPSLLCWNLPFISCLKPVSRFHEHFLL